MLKKIAFVVLLLALVGGGTAWYLWNKPHKKVEDIKGINITAVDLAKEYKADEKAADAKYLNKVIEVSGTVTEADKNQDGGIMVIIDAGDPMSSVQCSMRDKGVSVAKGQNTVIRGFCSGNGITGVSLTDCVIK